MANEVQSAYILEVVTTGSILNDDVFGFCHVAKIAGLRCFIGIGDLGISKLHLYNTFAIVCLHGGDVVEDHQLHGFAIKGVLSDISRKCKVVVASFQLFRVIAAHGQFVDAPFVVGTKFVLVGLVALTVEVVHAERVDIWILFALHHVHIVVPTAGQFAYDGVRGDFDVLGLHCLQRQLIRRDVGREGQRIDAGGVEGVLLIARSGNLVAVGPSEVGTQLVLIGSGSSFEAFHRSGVDVGVFC